MTPQGLADLIERAPGIASQRDVDIAFERLAVTMSHMAEWDRARLSALLERPAVRGLLSGVFSGSPFLTGHICRRPDDLLRVLADPPQERLNAILAAVRAAPTAGGGEEDFLRRLRIARNNTAVLVGLADLCGAWALEEVTGALTAFADAALGAACDYLLLKASEAGDIILVDKDAPSRGSGLIVLAMGKYGAGELNYSSDIDLIVFYDRERVQLGAGREPAPVIIRLVQNVARLLEQRTEDGYVFRVDLRLRPDGNASPVAVSTLSAELYYESSGQNWERAALIKARAAAGDLEAGNAFLKSIAPFIWRKNLDYAAIEDIHSIKRQIHAHKGHAKIAVAGHNLKLGRGGIREIEFFAQTQQLILGGRAPAFRARSTCAALTRLGEAGVIGPRVAGELIASYEFLRTMEHRLQMIDDEQTHTLPKSREALEAVARFAGYRSLSAFETDLIAHLTRVQGHYALLFEASETLASDVGSLVFTGVENDPETIRTLSEMGFARAEDVSSAIRAWHHGRIPATRSARAREKLTRLVPPLLKTLAKAKDPDEAFVQFSRFLEALPTGVQIFSLLVSNTWLLEVLSDAFGLAPRLARTLAEAPSSLDALIDPGFLSEPVRSDRLADGLAALLQRTEGLENQLDAVRIFAREIKFRISLQLLRASIDPAGAAQGFSDLADVVIGALALMAEADIARRHGTVDRGAWAIAALGKLGSREMTATSDLDLVFVYTYPDGSGESNGPQPLHPTQYYSRLCQRLISLLTAATSEGKLYEVDMRLRPSGGAGPVAVSLERFCSYHASEAWVFEHMALTRARVVFSSEGFGALVQQEIRRILTTKRPAAKVAGDALAMRLRLEEAKPERRPWRLKHVRGGLIDLEFIAQVLTLIHAPDDAGLLAPGTRATFQRLIRARIIPQEDGAILIAAFDLYQALSQILRVSVGAEVEPVEGGPRLLERLADFAGGAPPGLLDAVVGRAEAEVLRLFERYVGSPGRAASQEA